MILSLQLIIPGLSTEIQNLGVNTDKIFRARLIDPVTGVSTEIDWELSFREDFKWKPPDDREWLLHLYPDTVF